jgi:hypothetical protein
MKKLTLLLSLALASLVNIPPAMAAFMSYTLTGTGGASVGSTSYSGLFTMTGTGDNSVDSNPSPDITAFRMDNLTVAFGSNLFHATNPIFFSQRNRSRLPDLSNSFLLLSRRSRSRISSM